MAYYKVGNSFVWFMGRVANIEDPEYLGRVKIRIIHKQTGELGKKIKTQGIEDDDLLWAWPISAIQSASLNWRKVADKNHPLEGFDTPDWIDAVGLSPTGIAVGTYVFGFFLDGHEQNIPMIFGTYHKKSVHPEPPSQSRTNTMLQLQPSENPEYFSDVSALARGEFGNGGQTLPKKQVQAKVLSETSEPESAYKTIYPYNTTYTTKSGHAIEIDDTPGHERIHIWHNSGSYEEIANGPPKPGKETFEGRRVKKTTHSDYEIVMKDKNILIQDNKNEEIGKNLKIEIGEDGVINIKGNLEINANGIKFKAPGGLNLMDGNLYVANGNIMVSGADGQQASGVDGSFSTPTGQTVTVLNGIIVGIS